MQALSSHGLYKRSDARELVVPAPYFGSLSFWKILSNYSTLLVPMDAFYHTLPLGMTNRLVVQSAHQKHVLSIPIEGGRKARLRIKDIRINGSSNWSRRHLAVLQTCYGKCVFWEECRTEIYRLYQNKTFLMDFNCSAMEWLLKYIDLNLVIKNAPECKIANIPLDVVGKIDSEEPSILHHLMYAY